MCVVLKNMKLSRSNVFIIFHCSIFSFFIEARLNFQNSLSFVLETSQWQVLKTAWLKLDRKGQFASIRVLQTIFENISSSAKNSFKIDCFKVFGCVVWKIINRFFFYEVPIKFLSCHFQKAPTALSFSCFSWISHLW